MILVQVQMLLSLIPLQSLPIMEDVQQMASKQKAGSLVSAKDKFNVHLQQEILLLLLNAQIKQQSELVLEIVMVAWTHKLSCQLVMVEQVLQLI